MRRSARFAVKLAGSFVFVLMALGGTAILSIQQLARSSEQRETVARQYLEDVVHAERLRSAEDAEAAAGRGYLITHNADFLGRLDEAEGAFDRRLADLHSRVDSPDEGQLLGKVSAAAADYRETQRRALVEEVGGTQPDEVRRQFERNVVPKRRHLRDAVDAFASHQIRRLDAGYAEARGLTSRAVTSASIAVALAVVASALLAWLMGRHLAKSFGREAEALRLAERALATRDELLGIVAHDLRSPLSAIALKAGALRKTTAEEKTRSHAATIGSVAMRMESLIQSLLDAASIEAGRLSVSPAPCDVDATLRETFDMVASLAAPKSIQLERNAERPLSVMADRDRVIQVLTNLIGNAIKFTFEGGRIDVTAEREGNDVRFSVADTGPGIAPDHLAHIFDRFWKAEAGGKKGAGLGLYIAKGIVEAHGGRIWVKSQIGRGAMFHFTLPVTDQPFVRADKKPDRSGGAEPRNIHA